MFVSLACKPTAPDTEDQEHGHLDVPTFQLSADPVQNPALSAEMTYRGSAMVFDPAATAAQLSAVVEGTRQTRVTKANWLRVERRDVRPLTQKMNDIKLAITGVEAEARQDDNLRAAQEGTSRAWLAHQLDTEGLQGSERVEANAVWAAYCEAKIWELALSPRLVTQRYEERPTPLQLCEDVYAARQLMTGSRCTPADKSTGKSYFACLWRDGVMKTALYKARYDTTFPSAPTMTKAQKLMALIDDGDLAASLLDDRAPKVISGALAMDSLRLSRIFGAPFKELFIPEGGTPVDAPDLALAAASPSLLIGAVEDGPTAISAEALHWLPDAPWSKRLTASLKDMGARPLGDLSVSDYLFQRLADGAVATAPLALPVVKNNADFDFIFDAIGPEFAARLKALRQELAQITESRDVAAKHALQLFDAFATQMTGAASAATLSGDNSTLWIASILRLRRLEDGSFEARFSLDEVAGTMARGCFSSPNSASVPCPDEPDVVTEPMTITHAPATGALTIVMPMDSNELEIELYPNKIDEVLYFYSGLLHIRDGDEVLHEGGINLMTD